MTRLPLGAMRRREYAAPAKLGQFEVVKHGASRFDLSDPYSLAIELNWIGFALLFATLEVGINLVFATLYWLAPGSINNVPPGSFLYAFFFSIETLATVGYGVMSPATLYGHVLSVIEIITGIAFTAIMTGLTFVRFSRPRPRFAYADHLVICRYNRQPALMLRVGNARLTLMTDGLAQITVLLPERTAEGQEFRRTHEIKLIRSRSPLFALTWTLIHVIDADSPLHGMDQERMIELRARFFVSLEARDTKLGTTMHDLRQYAPQDVLWGKRYVDVITIDDAGRPHADFTRIGTVEPDVVEVVTEPFTETADNAG